MTTEEKLKQLIETEKKLAEYDGKDQVLPVDAVRGCLNLQQAKRNNTMSSGIYGLDVLIKGFWGGELTVISGLTGNGKTLLAQTLTAEFAEQEKKSLWFTFEVPALQFIEQFGEEMPPIYMPLTLTSNSLDWIRNRIWEAKLKYGLDAVFIDHLHFLIDMTAKHNMSLEIGHVMRTLKKLALEFNIAVFILAHTAKAKPDSELDIDSIRDSSFVAQEADNVFFIWRKSKIDNGAILKVAKNRRFGVMGKKIDMIKDGNYLKEAYSDR